MFRRCVIGGLPLLLVIAAHDGVLGDHESITIRVGNRAPGVSGVTSPFVITSGHSVNVTVLSTDADGDALTLEMPNAPAFATFTDNGDGTGILTLTPGSTQVGVYTEVSIVASDGLSTTTETFTINVITPACGAAGELANLINLSRSQAGRSGLLLDTRLTAAAQRHSNDMAATGVLSHTGSDGSTLLQRIGATGYPSASGELTASGFATAQQVVNGWQFSPPHHSMMTALNHRHLGAAFDGTFWTVTLGASDGPVQAPTGCVP